ncbi:hypothetical protein M9H77_10973 [Catharanthus roseus]|uniref:Uncharacterized protein n=1 Tax=Catharanthus roseus TaxID=4058 RepID=A0ACC0BD66_CATRO|nr:hypothetical protein M9H77_10973 [Catharanthus roseus]
MSACSLLEPTLRDILRVINPLREDWNIRFHIINELRSVILSIESLRGATVEPFGSFASNLFSRWGDLDISIELSNGSYISSAGKKHKQTLLVEVQRALRKKGGWHRLHFIANARVPILKFETLYNISCDISINNLIGQMKSKLLFWINEIDGRFRDVVLLVKEWAKAHNVNEPKSGSLNSYSLSLLVLFHFQTCVPAILPPLKDIYPGNVADDLTGVRAVAEKHVEETCAVNINRYRSDRSRIVNRSSISQLFISFFEKFSDINYKASTQGISLYTGQWEDINTNMRWLPKTYALFIEDPFEQPINAARTVSEKHLEKIAESVQTTYNVLNTRGLDKSLIISNLVRPHVSRFLGEGPGRNHNSYNNGNHSQNQRVMQPSPSQAQHSQYKKINKRSHANGTTTTTTAAQDKRPNGASYRPAQAQQVWKPRSETPDVL